MKIFLLFCFFCSFLQPDPLFSEEEDNEIPSPFTLTLIGGLTRALNHNRQILNSADSNVKLHFQVSLAYADFDLQVKPRGDAGYIGGGTAGAGIALGTGIEFSKRFSYGTRISVTPSLMKANEMYRSHIKAIISQPLLRGFGQEAGLSYLKACQFALRTATRSFFTSQTHLIIKTIVCLYDVLKSQKMVELNKESYKRIQKFYQTANLKAKIGLSDPLDVYRAEIEMRQAKDVLETSLVKLQESEDIIKDLLALPPETVIKIDLPISYTPHLLVEEEAVDLALQYRVELDQAQDQQQENVRLSHLAKDQLWPELNLVLNYSSWAQDQIFTDSYARKRENSWGIGFTTASDFNPVAEQTAYEQSLLAVNIAKRSFDQTLANVTFEVKRSLRSLERTFQRIELQKKQIHTSEGELHLAQVKFDRGMGSNFDLIQAEKNWRNAELSYWNALIDYIVGEYQLRETLGILMEKPCL